MILRNICRLVNFIAQLKKTEGAFCRQMTESLRQTHFILFFVVASLRYNQLFLAHISLGEFFVVVVGGCLINLLVRSCAQLSSNDFAHN